jgi:hypothetical protein
MNHETHHTALCNFYFELEMIAGIIGAIFALLLILNGWSGLRKSLDELVQYDPIGKRMLEKRGPQFTLRIYRIMGILMLLLGLTAAYLSVQFILAG